MISGQSARTRRFRLSYRILALDGGGTWALIQAKALGALYKGHTPGREILSRFDLVAANSGGSIVLAGLLENWSPDQIFGFFNDSTKRRSVFSETFLGSVLGRSGIAPKYSAYQKLKGLQAALTGTGSMKLPDAAALVTRSPAARIRLLITAFDYDRNRAAFFRSAPTDPGWGDSKASDVTIAEAVHASTNAPVQFFDGPATLPGRDGRYWDGAISGCNNPVLAAVTEAITANVHPSDIVALSIGTGTQARPWPRPGPEEDSPLFAKKSDGGQINDLKKLASSILDDPPDIATFLAHVLTGGSAGLPPKGSRIVRMNPLIGPRPDGNSWITPGTMSQQDFEAMLKLGMDAVKDNDVARITQYADLWLKDKALNQPVRMNGDTLKLEIGQAFFGEAAAAWTALEQR